MQNTINKNYFINFLLQPLQMNTSGGNNTLQMVCKLVQPELLELLKCNFRYKMQISNIHHKLHCRIFHSSFLV
jgi:hypothetical protein